MRESDIENYLVERVQALGGMVRKVVWQGRRGAPDRLVVLPLKKEGLFYSDPSIWIELKAPGKTPEPHQEREHARMRKYGLRVEVVDSIERVNEVLK